MSPAQHPATATSATGAAGPAGETGSAAASRARHAHSHSQSQSQSATTIALATRPRRTTAQSDIHETILHPGNVKINVQGAFIVDEEQPGTPQSEDYEHDPKDIRLPNHTAVVSHIAVDVSTIAILLGISSGVACSFLRWTRDNHLAALGTVLTNMRAHRLAALWQSSSTSPANTATTPLAAA
jgi:hypothetical protein